MSDLKRAREILTGALDMDATENDMRAAIAAALPLMFREYTKPRSKPESRRMTVAIGQQIKAYYVANRDLSILDLAYAFGVGTGRVSEALAGKWDSDAVRRRIKEQKKHGGLSS